eukprot:924935-Amorphochlora_amoeboformis.AAC.1
MVAMAASTRSRLGLAAACFSAIFIATNSIYSSSSSPLSQGRPLMQRLGGRLRARDPPPRRTPPPPLVFLPRNNPNLYYSSCSKVDMLSRHLREKCASGFRKAGGPGWYP